VTDICLLITQHGKNDFVEGFEVLLDRFEN